MDMEGNMSDLTDRLIAEANTEPEWTSVHKLLTEAADEIDRLKAALSASPAGVVKPLEWRTFCSRSGNCEAKTALGEYVLQFEGLGFDASWKLYLPHNDYSTGVCYHTLEAAKSAAFADYSARIMSAIEPAGVVVEMAPEGWTVTRPTYHKYPHVVEWICGEWHLRKHHGNGASHTVSTHATHTDAISALKGDEQ